MYNRTSNMCDVMSQSTVKLIMVKHNADKKLPKFKHNTLVEQ